MPMNIFNTFDDPLAFTGTTVAFGVNDKDQIVGQFQNGLGTRGFLESGGTYTTLDDPLASAQAGGTTARGINASGQIVGQYSNNTGTHGFLLSGANFTWTTLDDPLA